MAATYNSSTSCQSSTRYPVTLTIGPLQQPGSGNGALML